jgi:1,4-alpha-glucan branching enzyme
MAVRKKTPDSKEATRPTATRPSNTTKGGAAQSGKKSTPREPAAPQLSAGERSKATRTKKPPAAADVDVLQTVGADFVPSMTIEADAPAAAMAGRGESSTADAAPTAAGASSSTTRTRGASKPSVKAASRKVSAADAKATRSVEQAPAAIESPGRREDAVERPVETPAETPAPAMDVIDPAAIRQHTVDQIAAVDQTRPQSRITDWDIHLFAEGTHHKLWEKLGSHIVPGGVQFAVWAPNAERVSVVGDFNGWNRDAHPLRVRDGSGIWEGFIEGVSAGTTYKYHIVSRLKGFTVDKADPFAIHHETPPNTASKVWPSDYEWSDAEWMKTRRAKNALEAPMTTYELHLGSWRRVWDEHDQRSRSMNYRELAQPLAEYVRKMNFTHVELLPVMEHPFFGSWGYQCTGFFAPSSRFGTPQDLKYLIDVLHQHGIGVILDWVPSHFPTDEHGLAFFDGTHLYEHSDPRKGFHPDWGSLIFNYGRNEVRSFLLSSALYWLEEFHADGLRVDAVASMLYLDYSRKAGEWIPNEFGGRENVEAISFLRRLNEDVYKVHPDVQVIAEESTAWPMVSRPIYVGGLGFGMKWDMGWMHDTLRYFSKDPIHRKYHHNDLTFRMMYAFTENFVLPLSHDEVVHGKGSLINKMPGDHWQKAANLRLLFAHMYGNPGKKLVFMGGEIGQFREWNHDGSLDWDLLEHPLHAGINRWVEDLNKFYRDVPAMHELDVSPEGFEWIDCCDTEGSIVTLMRRSKSRPEELVVVALNFTPLPRHNYQIGIPRGGHWEEALNSDAQIYGGSGQGNMGGVDAAPLPMHGRKWSATVTIPPLGAVFLISRGEPVSETASEKRSESLPAAKKEKREVKA